MKTTAKTVGIVMIIMLFSRFLSLISNSVYMTAFGANTQMDIYSFAMNLPNIIFVSLGTALTTVVIPIFAGYIGKGEKPRAYKFADNIISLSTIFTAGLSVLGILLAPVILLLTPSFRQHGYDFALMALRFTLPIMIFYALNYILQGILQSLGRFNMPAFVSVPGSLIIILYVYTLGPRYGIKGLLMATLTGLAFQALILIPPVFKTEYRFHPSFHFREGDVIEALRLIPPILIGTSAYQLNMLFNTTIAANFEGAVGIMTLVQNLTLYAVLALVYSITAVVFPKFTILAAQNDMEGFKENVSKVLKTIAYFLIPLSVGFIAVGHQLLNLMYGWGKFTSNNVGLAFNMMMFYAIGVTGIGIKEVIDRAFYSLKDTKKPALNGVVIMLVNIAVSLSLIRFFGVLGIPLAYSVSALTGALVILYLLRKKIGPFGRGKLGQTAVKIIIASAIMFAVIIPVNILLQRFTFGHAFVDRGIKLILPTMIGIFVYFIATYLLRVGEAVEILQKVRSRLKRA